MAILITGGSGFVGSKIVGKAILAGHEICYPRSLELNLMSGPYEIRKYIKKNKINIIIHSAALYGGLNLNLCEPAELFYKNSIMAANVIYAAGMEKIQKTIVIGSSCFPAKTKIIMGDYTTKNIEDIKQNDLILARNGQQKVSNTMLRHYEGPMVEFQCTSTLPIKCTTNHEFLIYKGDDYIWKKASELQIGDRLCTHYDNRFYNRDSINIHNDKFKYLYEITNKLIPLSKNDKYYYIAHKLKNINQKIHKYYNDLLITEKISYLLGAYVAEGYLNEKRGSMSLSPGFDQTYVDKILEGIGALELIPSVRTEKTSIRINFNNKQLLKKIFVKFYNNNGHKAHNKIIPKFIFKMSKHNIIKFLQGYWDGDGCIYDKTNRPAAVAVSTSVDLIYGIKYLLAKLGIVSNMKFRVGNPHAVIENRKITARHSYCLRITGQNFRKFMSIIYNNNSYKKTPNQSRSCQITNNKIIMPIIKIKKYDYNGIVFNFEVPKTNTYTINGVICHNCSYPSISKKMKEKDFWNGPLDDSVESYGFSKRHLLCGQKAIWKQFGVKMNHLILTNLYGEEDDFGEYRGHAISILIKRIIDAKRNNLKQITNWGNGKAIREFLYAGDAAKAIVNFIEQPHDIEPINIGPGIGISIKKLVKMICEIVGYNGEVVWDKTKPNGTMKKVMDNKKFRKIFPEFKFTKLRDGLEKTIYWYLKNN